MKNLNSTSHKKEISLLRIIFRLIPMVFAACPIFFIITNLVSIIHGVSHGMVTFAAQWFFDTAASAVSNRSGFSMVVIWTAAAFGAVTIGAQVLNGLHNFMTNVFFQKMAGFLSMMINQKACKVDPVSYESPSLLDDINKANEGMKNSLDLLIIFTTLFTFYLPYFLFMGVYLFRLKPILSISLLLIFVPVAITQLIRGVVFARLEDQSAPIRREYEYYERCICDREYFKETRLLGAFEFFMGLYRSSLLLLGKKVWDAELKTGLLELGMKMITLTGYLGVLYLLFVSLLRNEITIGAFGAVFASIGLMFSIMEEIVCRHVGRMTKNLGTVRNFIRFLDMPERKGKDMVIDPGSGIVLRDVSFRYPNSENYSLSHISLDVRKNETIAIVGENGAGKTTLVKLMTGLYLPTEGIVEVGGVNTADISPTSMYKGISAVFQKYQKYKMTLSENIGISDIEEDDFNKDRLQSASDKADLNINETSFPQGYDTMLSREFDGVDLSGGQWQRIAIARGFYRVHDMIVLDEPTAAIDPIEETRIYNKFAEISKDKTAIIVTHRLGSAKLADRIVVLEDGKIAGIGTHDELMKAKGKYAQMFNAQAQWYVS